MAGYNIDWHPEIIEDNKNGFLVSPGNSKKLASSVERIIKNSKLSKKFSRNLRIKAEQILSPKLIVDLEIECFKKIYKNS